MRASELAQLLDLSLPYLSQRCRELVGVNLSRALKRQQVRYAAKLLRETGLNNAEIAEAAGFGTEKTLFRVFGMLCGTTPQAYRRHMKK